MKHLRTAHYSANPGVGPRCKHRTRRALGPDETGLLIGRFGSSLREYGERLRQRCATPAMRATMRHSRFNSDSAQ